MDGCKKKNFCISLQTTEADLGICIVCVCVCAYFFLESAFYNPTRQFPLFFLRIKKKIILAARDLC